MYMVSVYRARVNHHFMSPRRLTQQFPTTNTNVPSKHRIAILRRPHQVILAVPNRMAAALVRFHPANLYSDRPRSQPPKGMGFPDPLSGTLNDALDCSPCLEKSQNCEAGDRGSDMLERMSAHNRANGKDLLVEKFQQLG